MPYLIRRAEEKWQTNHELTLIKTERKEGNKFQSHKIKGFNFC
jgi:hypothetical protein